MTARGHQQKHLPVLAALGFVHRERQGRFGPRQPGGMEQPISSHQHQPLPVALHQHADLAVGQVLLGMVAAVEHRRAQGPALQRARRRRAQQGTVQRSHAPVPLPQGA